MTPPLDLDAIRAIAKNARGADCITEADALLACAAARAAAERAKDARGV